MKQQIISLLERAKENGRTIGDVLAQVRGMCPVCPTCDDHGAVGNILDTVQCPDCASRPATPAASAPSDEEILILGGSTYGIVADDSEIVGFGRALLARYGAQPAASAEPVAFYKDGVLFWHGEHAAWRGKDGELYARPPAPSERAPVGDERAAFKKCHAAIIKAISSIARADGPDTRKEDDPELLYRSPVMDEVARIRGALDEYSAALASAPVAGEAQKPVAWMKDDGSDAWTDAKKKLAEQHAGAPGAIVASRYTLPLYAAPQASPAADGRDAKDAARKTAGNIQEPMNGDGWHVFWWNESMRLMLPDGSRLDRFRGYRNGTMQLTIKTDAAIAAQQGEGEDQ